MVQRSPNTVARGLAAAFHSYLTNVIYGVDGVSWSHEEALHDYLKSQHLRNDEFTWISDKVLLLFPDSARISDSVPDMLKREKDRRECLGLVNQTIRHHYEVAGKQRQSVLHVFKLRHGGPNGWRNNYFIFAENRPLVSLHQVRTIQPPTPPDGGGRTPHQGTAGGTVCPLQEVRNFLLDSSYI